MILHDFGHGLAKCGRRAINWLIVVVATPLIPPSVNKLPNIAAMLDKLRQYFRLESQFKPYPRHLKRLDG